jgi:hypothetical protein
LAAARHPGPGPDARAAGEARARGGAVSRPWPGALWPRSSSTQRRGAGSLDAAGRHVPGSTAVAPRWGRGSLRSSASASRRAGGSQASALCGTRGAAGLAACQPDGAGRRRCARQGSTAPETAPAPRCGTGCRATRARQGPMAVPTLPALGCPGGPSGCRAHRRRDTLQAGRVSVRISCGLI